MTLPIKATLDRVPGGMMLILLLLGAVIHTILPTVGLYKEAAGQATILIAASVIVTAILVPLATAAWARHVGAEVVPFGQDEEQEDEEAGPPDRARSLSPPQPRSTR